jgi:hypothetical protein
MPRPQGISSLAGQVTVQEASSRCMSRRARLPLSLSRTTIICRLLCGMEWGDQLQLALPHETLLTIVEAHQVLAFVSLSLSRALHL